jgi:hypothetical protein
VLTSVLPLPALSFERLTVSPRVAQFDPGPLGIAIPAPNWEDFAPPAEGTKADPGWGRTL